MSPERPGGGQEWFVSRGESSPWAARVYCFPYAGGNPRTFLEWQTALEHEAEVLGVCAPGRWQRAGEPVPSFDELAAGAAAAIAGVAAQDGRPVYLFGHSLGALVAFEAARLLHDLPVLRHLVVSGMPWPALVPTERVKELGRLEGKAFAEALAQFGGLPPELVHDDELLELLLPGVITDFRMAVGYTYRPAPPLTVDMTVANGLADDEVGPAEVEGWRKECRNEPAVRWFPGGHFYFEEHPSAVTDLLLEIIRADQHVELI
jgi:surfactin synthase thioesterase subunit